MCNLCCISFENMHDTNVSAHSVKNCYGGCLNKFVKFPNVSNLKYNKEGNLRKDKELINMFKSKTLRIN